MRLSQFDVLGDDVSDEETEELVKKGDTRRSLVRYQPDGGELPATISEPANAPCS